MPINASSSITPDWSFLRAIMLSSAQHLRVSPVAVTAGSHIRIWPLAETTTFMQRIGPLDAAQAPPAGFVTWIVVAAPSVVVPSPVKAIVELVEVMFTELPADCPLPSAAGLPWMNS
jgi:hypothetical protein